LPTALPANYVSSWLFRLIIEAGGEMYQRTPISHVALSILVDDGFLRAAEQYAGSQ